MVSLDNIEQMFDRLEAEGGDLRPEQARWESILRRISTRPNSIASPAAAAGGMARLRKRNPPAESFWWEVEKLVAARRRRDMLRMGAWLGAILIAIGLVYLVVTVIFPPDPAAVLLVQTQSEIDQLVLEERWEEALAAVKTAQESLPDSPELLAWEAVLSERLGNQAHAETLLSRLTTLLPDQPTGLWILVGNDRLQAGDFDGAEAAAQRALEFDAESARAVFLLANVADLRGDRGRAIELFDETYALAEENEPQLAVIAKVRLGELLQQFGAVGPPTPEAEADGNSSADDAPLDSTP